MEAINKKEGATKFLADLNKIRKEYVQDDVGLPSENSILQPNENVNPIFSKDTLTEEEAEALTEKNSQLYESLRDKDVSYDEKKP